nr:hypothetical protein [Tanacetum cinerariifolium]
GGGGCGRGGDECAVVTGVAAEPLSWFGGSSGESVVMVPAGVAAAVGVSGVVDDGDGGCSGGAGCGVVGTATAVVGVRVAVAARGVGSVWRGDSGGGLWILPSD